MTVFEPKVLGMTPKLKIFLYMSCLLMGMSVTGVVAGPDENDIEGPSFVDVLTLKSIEGVQIAPDG
ncbi:MAG: hypothetical protein HOM16_05265, partial [Woeseia sp.]|nr:hypothetical protein [Woeseia sp.]